MKILNRFIAAAMATAMIVPTLFVSGFAAKEELAVYVSATGSDSAGGSYNSPMRSISNACIKAGKLAAKENKPVDVILKDGKYRISDTVMLTQACGGAETAPVRIKAENKGKAVITAAKELSGKKFAKVTDKRTLKRMPSEAAGKVYVLNLSDVGITSYGTIERVERHKVQTPSSTIFMVDGNMLTLAEWPNKAFTTINNVGAVASGYKFSISEDRIKRWTTATELYAYGNFNADWADETFKLKNLNTEERSVETTYTTVHGVSNGGQVRFINLLEELDIPGEWFLDRSAGKIYYYPLKNPKDSTIELVTTQKALFNLTNVDNLVFDGLVFEGTCGPGMVFENANNNVVTNCEFRNIGQQVMLIKDCRNNLIDNNEMHDIGKGCIHISGGERVNLTPSNNIISNNHMERFAVIGKRYCEAVELYGVGDVLRNNRIHNAPHHAVRFDGALNLIEYNDIYDVLEETGDAGAIYAGRSWTNGGNIIRYNYIHDCAIVGDSGRAGIYCDDYMTDVDIYGNIFANLNTGVTMHSSQLCTVENNLFSNIATDAVFLYNIDLRSDASVRSDNEKAIRLYNEGKLQNTYTGTYSKAHDLYKNYYKYYTPDNKAYNQHFPYLKDITKNLHVLSPRDDVIEHNVCYGKGKINVTSGVAKETGSFENNYETTETAPAVNAQQGDYTLADNSKVKEYFDLEKYGEKLLPELKEIGIKGENLSELKDFNTIAPIDGAANVEASDVVLCWEDVSGADKYRIIVARDAEFKDIVCNEVLNSTYKRFRNLKYGSRRYYWKVEAIGTSYLYKAENTKLNSNGVQTFVTAQTENVDKTELKETIDTAETLIAKSIEGTEPGELRKGAVDILKSHLGSAKKVYNLATSSKKRVERITGELESAITVFECSRNAQEIDFKAMANDSENWAGIAKPIADGVAFETDGSGGYNGNLLKAHHILKMTAEFTLNDNGYTSIGLRSGNYAVVPWNTTEYIFLVKKDVVELQRFNGDERFFFDKPNQWIKTGKPVQLEFGAVTEADGIRITVKVDGNEVFNYLDADDFAVTTPGKFHVYNNSGSKVKIFAAK